MAASGPRSSCETMERKYVRVLVALRYRPLTSSARIFITLRPAAGWVSRKARKAFPSTAMTRVGSRHTAEVEYSSGIVRVEKPAILPGSTYPMVALRGVECRQIWIFFSRASLPRSTMNMVSAGAPPHRTNYPFLKVFVTRKEAEGRDEE